MQLGVRLGMSPNPTSSTLARHVHFNTHSFTDAPPFCSNSIQTAKYNAFTFVPRNFLDQFSRVANLYFVLIVCLQMVPSIRTTHPLLAGLPLTVIILITMAKDGIEDWKRHVADNSVNRALVRVLVSLNHRTPSTNVSPHTIPQHDLPLSIPDPFHVSDRLCFMNQPKQTDVSMPASLVVTPACTSNLPPIQESAPSPTLCTSTHLSERVSPRTSWHSPTNDRVTPIDPKIAFSNQSIPNFSLSNHQPLLQRRRSSTLCIPNNIPASWVTATWEKIQVGDLVFLQNNEAIPADIVLIVASELNSTCYVETKSLDGEANLKLRHGFPEFAHVSTAEQCENLRFDIECEPPNPSLYTYRGTLRVEVEGGEIDTLPIHVNNLLLRGSILRNTQWVIGAVVYTGKETKIMLNSGETQSKRSKIDAEMQPQVILNFGLLFVLCMTCAVLNSTWKRSMAVFGYTDLQLFERVEDTRNIVANALFTFFSSLVVFQNIVPISLYVSIEFVKTVQAYFIYSDPDLSLNDKPCKPRTWNISDDLGQVQYVFSDKTGTLTCNKMEFKLACIAGHVYGGDLVDEFLATQASVLPNPYATHAPSFSDSKLIHQMACPPSLEWSILCKHFFMLLSLCHTVQVNDDPDEKIKYLAQSPDEGALVAAARDFGYTFVARNQTHLTLCIHGHVELVQLLHVIEFNSTRKRMSVVVRTSDNAIFVYTKGADSHVFPRLAPKQDAIQQSTLESLEMFATKGLRTLALAYRELSLHEYTEFSARFASANLVINGREDAIYRVADDLEQNLTLLGATAIEDKLQWGVPEAIETLSAAGVHVWVLTGDKTETAINVGYASRLITPVMTLVLVRGDSESESVENQVSAALKLVESAEQSESVLVVDGDALGNVMDSALKPAFLDLCLQCSHVICCRVSPLQKAQVVALIRSSLDVITLAIGDGANDVSMIQEANVGVGIMGEEGMQAVMSSDYAISQFRFLVKLMLLHGRWSQVRIATMIHNFFYKNMTWAFVMFWYQFYSGFSAELMYDYSFLIFYNVLFTLLPCVVMGVFDQDLPLKTLAKYPQLYQPAKLNFSRKMFWLFVGEATYQSVVCFFVPYLAYFDTIVQSNGLNPHKLESTLPMGMAAVMSVNLFVGLNLRSVNWISGVSIAISAVSLPLFLILYSLLPGPMNGFAGTMFAEPSLWLSVLLAVVVSLLPRALTRFVLDTYFFDDAQIIREVGAFGLVWPHSRHTNFALNPLPNSVPSFSSATKYVAELVHSPIETVADETSSPHSRIRSFHHSEDCPDSEMTSFLYDAKSRRSIGRTGFAFSQSRGASETVVTATCPPEHLKQHGRRASLIPSEHSVASLKSPSVGFI